MDICKNCYLEISQYQSCDMREPIWHHVALTDEQEKLVTFCPNDLGEAEPMEAAA